MKYVLGLDIGIASVGWAVLDPDSKRIVDLGVRAFTAAENPKNKSPLAEPRRLARSARRRLRRRAGRMRRVKELFVREGLINADELETVFLTAPDKADPWELRAVGLDRRLTPEEFARALFHIAKRRGFKSNRKTAADKEEGRMLESIVQNRQVLEEKGYRTAGEMLYKDERFRECRRNKADSYENTVDRAMLEDEINILFEFQRQVGNPHATPEIQAEYLDLFRWQMPFSSGEAILRKVGKCTFEPEEYRAPKNAPTVERFTLLQKINQLNYFVNGDKHYLTPEERKAVIAEAYSRAELKYSHVRKMLALPEEARFPGLQYSFRRDGHQVESLDCEKRALCPMHGYNEIRKALTKAGLWEDVKDDIVTLDHLATALTLYKTDEDMRGYLSGHGITDGLADALGSIPSFKGFGHLSLKSLRKIVPFLEEGDMYHIACEKAGYNHSMPSEGERLKKLPVIDPDDVRNPVVLRAITQARKVINAVIERYGSPYRVHIELARDIGKTAEERDKITRRQEDNRKTRETDKAHFLEVLGGVCSDPNGEDLLKWRLYREQNGQCAYSHEALDINRLTESGYVEIDHILPYSRSFDDMPANKILVLGRENRLKKNRTPCEYFGSDTQRWERFEAWVNTNIRDFRKRRNLLRLHFDDKAETEFMERNLNDTRWIGRYLTTLMRETLIFADPEEKIPVVCLSGRVTSMARGLWGLSKNREESDLHHAVDAACAAALTPALIQRITQYRKLRELGRIHPGEDWVVDTTTGEVIEFSGARQFTFPQPWEWFRQELLARLSDDPASEIAALKLPNYDGVEVRPVLVSRMSRRKVKGQMHEETIRSVKHLDKGVSTVRKRLVSLSPADLDKLVAPETNEKLYAAIRERMEQFGGDAQKAFAEPLYKPTNDGTLGPPVRSVKVCQTQNSGIPVRGGMADNSSMVKIDISREQSGKGGWKWYATPVYTRNIMADDIPEAPGEFMFSLYPYDLIRLVRKGEELFGYYRKYNTNTQSITICAPNNSQLLTQSIGIRNAEVFEKYSVGILGDYCPAGRDPRRGVESIDDQQSGKADD